VAIEGVSIGSLLGSSQAMVRVRAFGRRAAQVNVPVLILGETGTGKSLLGKAIHQESSRAPGPYLAINCAGIPDSLFESEFFGHQRGAFTGAREGRRGILEQAQGGSLFLDEVGELSVPQQAKLLTALEEGEIRRLGGEGTVRVDVRVLAATSRDLAQEMREGGFRRELFHRLAVLTCHIRPLRARREDVPLLARRFFRKHQERHGRPPTPLSPETLRYLEAQSWPGNVRELSHLLEAALILSEDGALEVEALRAAGAMAEGGGETQGSRLGRGDGSSKTGSTVVEISEKEEAPGIRRYAFFGSEDEEREVIRSALTRVRGNKSRAARELGMARNTLRQKLRKYGFQ
jgi:DNA-binding NtrC family response regulator